MKDIKKMQKKMKEEGYCYCENHDIYYDEWLKCPACQVELVFNAHLSRLPKVVEDIKKLIEKFDPNDRD